MPGIRNNPGGALDEVLDDLSDMLNGRPPRNGQYQKAPQLIPIPIPVDDVPYGRQVQQPGSRYPPNYGPGGYYGMAIEQTDIDGSKPKQVPLFNI